MLPGDDGTEPLPGAPRRRPQLADLMPPEEQSDLLNRLSAAGSSGLAGLGWILDTPGAVVRGTLSGGPLKGLSALWDTTDERVDGRELLRQYGMVGDDDTWGNFAGGLGAEVLLDPLTYMSFGLNQFLGKGAKTAAGRAAGRAGLLQDFDVYAKNTLKTGERQALREQTPATLLAAIADPEARKAAAREFALSAGDQADALMNQPLAKMNRVGLPFMQDGAFDLFGETVGDWAAKTADKLGEGLMTNPYTGLAARGVQRAFDPNVLGMLDRQQQWDAKTIMAARRARESTDRLKLSEVQYDALKDLRSKGSTLNDDELSQALRYTMESPDFDIHPDLQPHADLPGVRGLLSYARNYRDQAIAQAQKLGLPLEEFRSRTGGGWFPRQQLEFDTPQIPQWPEGVTPPEYIKKQYARGVRPVTFDDNLSRGRDAAFDVFGQSETLNRMSTDPDLLDALRGADNPKARELLEKWWQDNADLHPREMSGDYFVGDGVGDHSVLRTEGAGPGGDMYGWMDMLKDDGTPMYKAPELGDAHPLRRQIADVEKQIYTLENASADPTQMASLKKQLKGLRSQVAGAETEAWRDQLYTKLADTMRAVDPQHVETGLPLFGQNSFNELSRYVLGRGRAEANAQGMLDILAREVDRTPADAVAGGVNYTAADALTKLGLTGETAPDVLAKAMGVEDLSQVSFNKKFIDDWTKAVGRGQTPPEISGLAQGYDNFTKRFKALALLWPARYTRDAYSGMFAGAMKGASPLNWWTGTQVGRGDYSELLRKLKDIPRYRGMSDDEMLRDFLTKAGSTGLGVTTANDELLAGAGKANLRGLYPGAVAQDTESLASRASQASWKDWLNVFSLPTASGNRNPLLEAGDRASQFTDSGNRYGTYLSLMQNGYSPAEAARVTNLTQVDYRPEAFTDFERDVLKRIFPFYSYTKGITPLIADEVVNKPAGLMGTSMRAINRGAQPSENNFTPEYLRQSASVPVPSGIPGVSLPEGSNLKRYLTNIDLPFESAINLLTPGTGNSLLQKLASGARKTALNVLGQTNPLIKGPLESATNRQFYSGRQLSDLYSLLEQTAGEPGRWLEQIAVNAPGGSRVIGTLRQALDDRLSPQEKLSKFLVNSLTGLKFQDVDQERTKRLAAREMLNELLQATPGVRTYENITVPDDVLQTMPEEQRRQYLLYKIVQAQAAKRARDQKKQDALDPLQILGVTR
jgi:hypothetical protein